MKKGTVFFTVPTLFQSQENVFTHYAGYEPEYRLETIIKQVKDTLDLGQSAILIDDLLTDLPNEEYKELSTIFGDSYYHFPSFESSSYGQN